MRLETGQSCIIFIVSVLFKTETTGMDLATNASVLVEQSQVRYLIIMNFDLLEAAL